MRIAILSDIHSNLEALRRVQENLEILHPDRIYCCGDIVGYGPYPNECLDIVRALCHGIVGGNHDMAVAGRYPLNRFNLPGRKVIRWTRKIIRREHLDFLNTLPRTIVENNVTIVHSSPADTDGWTYLYSLEDVRNLFDHFSTKICFVGHSHIPFVAGNDGSIGALNPAARYVINVGSIGQPRTGGKEAVFGYLDTDIWSYELIRVPYDVSMTAAAIREAGLPEILARRLLSGF